MLKNFIACIIFMLAIATTALGQDQSQIEGRVVLATDTTHSLPYVQVVNTQRFRGAVSDEDGYYKLMAAPGDTIEFRMIGYEVCRLSFSALEKIKFVVPMKERIATMQTVTIRAQKQSYQSFAPEKKSDDPYVGYRSVKPSGRARVEHKIGLATTGSGAALEGAVTQFANLFNKKEKQREKIRELMANARDEEYYQALYAHWFEKETVTKLTGYSDQKLDEFLKFCKPSLSFLESTTEYQLILAVWDYQRQFETMHLRQ